MRVTQYCPMIIDLFHLYCSPTPPHRVIDAMAFLFHLHRINSLGINTPLPSFCWSPPFSFQYSIMAFFALCPSLSTPSPLAHCIRSPHLNLTLCPDTQAHPPWPQPVSPFREHSFIASTVLSEGAL